MRLDKMELIKNIDNLRKRIEEFKRKNYSLGLVPTMGYLHKGHASLIRQAKKENDIVIVSIFVNPKQFGPNEDLNTYPRDIERDKKVAGEAGADIIFLPNAEEIYQDSCTSVEVEGELPKKLCGASRHIHFKGVTTIISILFNIVQPDCAYFGQKDAQQVIIVKKMVHDLHYRINIRVCPIIRDTDGLAMSSRNTYLSQEEREQALSLNRSLKKAKLYSTSKAKDHGNITKLRQIIRNEITCNPLAKIEYIEILDANTLKEMDELKVGRKALVALAVRFGKTRLIDNTLLIE